MSKLTILIDTREQRPLDFANLNEEKKNGVEFRTAHLYPGDYSVLGLQQRYAVERKGVGVGGSADIVGTILELLKGERNKGGSLRFLRELSAMGAINRGGGLAYVAITKPRAWFASHQYRSELTPAALFAKIASLEARFGVCFCFFASDYELRDRIMVEAEHMWRRAYTAHLLAKGAELMAGQLNGGR